MKADIQISDLSVVIMILLISFTLIIGGVQGFLYQDSILRGYPNYKFSSGATICGGIIGLVGAVIAISRM